MTSLLFHENQLVFDDVYQDLIFTEDPDSCECCGIEVPCECADGSSPSVWNSVQLAIASLPATYQEELLLETSIFNGQIWEYQNHRRLELTLNGMDGLNGTYIGSLEGPTPGSSCDSSSTTSCALTDSRRNCRYSIGPITSAVTGTLVQTYYDPFIPTTPVGFPAVITWTITGTISCYTGSVPGPPTLCLTFTPDYVLYVPYYQLSSMNDNPTGLDAWSFFGDVSTFGRPPRADRYSDCSPQWGLAPFPNNNVAYGPQSVGVSPVCSESTTWRPPWQSCTRVTPTNRTFSLPSCSDTQSLNWRQRVTWDLDAVDYTMTWTIT